MGYDPGLNNAGIVVIDTEKEKQESIVFIHYYKNKGKQTKRPAEVRMWEQFLIMDKAVDEFCVDIVVTENQYTGAMVGLDAIPRLVAGKYDIPCFRYAPRHMKKYLTQNSLASKLVMKQFLVPLYGTILEQEEEHTIDAVGFVETHIRKAEL